MKSGYSETWVSDKIAYLVREGYPQKQAVAIALNQARQNFRRTHPQGRFPRHLTGAATLKNLSGRASRNPVPESMNSRIRKAAQLYEDFSGHEAEEIGTVKISENPKVAIAVGEIEAIIYNTVRDGVKERYIHKFKASARPLFCVSFDGKQLLLVGGEYDFTERGIVDRT